MGKLSDMLGKSKPSLEVEIGPDEEGEESDSEESDPEVSKGLMSAMKLFESASDTKSKVEALKSFVKLCC